MGYRELLTFLIFISLPCLLPAQSAVIPAGDDAMGAGGSISYTVGQIDYGQFSSEDGMVQLGVQQPNLSMMVSNHDLTRQFEIIITPNPTIDDAQVYFQSSELTSPLQFRLYNSGGVLLQSGEIRFSQTTIPMDQLTPATYFLQVRAGDILLKTFKIVKAG